MEPSKINKTWPNSLRWFLNQNLHSFTPWHLLRESEEFEFASKAFEAEDMNKRNIFVFASRQDNDDFAGIEIRNGKLTEKVICFHPAFSSGISNRKWNIVDGEYEDVFEFISKRVVVDMKVWALTDDASDL